MEKKLELYQINGYLVKAKSFIDACYQITALRSMGKGPGDYSKEHIDHGMKTGTYIG